LEFRAFHRDILMPPLRALLTNLQLDLLHFLGSTQLVLLTKICLASWKLAACNAMY
jgi:hypothetical protein